MKKKYIMPQTKVIEMKVQLMQALSAKGSTNQTYGNLGRYIGDEDDWKSWDYSDQNLESLLDGF